MLIEYLIGNYGVPLIILLSTTLCLAAAYFYNLYNFWTIRGVPGPRPIWFIGNSYQRLRSITSMAEYDQNLYEDFNGKRFCGFFEFTKPTLMIGDPELLKHVLIRDFDCFTDRSMVSFNEPVMDSMLLGLRGPVWKAVRSVMTPTFSSGKIKQTFSLVKDCSENLAKYFNDEVNQGHCVFEMKGVYGKFTMDTIANIAFGVNSNSLNNQKDEFTAAAAKFFTPVNRWKRPLVYFTMLWPQVAKTLGINVFDKTSIRFFSQVVSETIKYRLENNVRRSDFLQILLDARIQEILNIDKNKEKGNENSTNEPILTEEVITSQCVLFYIAGYDTTATTLSFVSYCLALHPRIQQTLLEEVDALLEKYNGEVSYEAIQELTYMDMVFNETLRLYPPAPRIDRRCTKDYQIPGTDLVICKDTKVIIPIYSIHRDSNNYPEPLKFNPERFSLENKKKRPQTTYLPFGSGPRNCIGGRFAMMEAKVALVYILKDFAFIPSKKTQVPIIIEKRSGLLKAEDGIWVRLAKRTDE